MRLPRVSWYVYAVARVISMQTNGTDEVEERVDGSRPALIVLRRLSTILLSHMLRRWLGDRGETAGNYFNRYCFLVGEIYVGVNNVHGTAAVVESFVLR